MQKQTGVRKYKATRKPGSSPPPSLSIPLPSLNVWIISLSTPAPASQLHKPENLLPSSQSPEGTLSLLVDFIPWVVGRNSCLAHLGQMFTPTHVVQIWLPQLSPFGTGQSSLQRSKNHCLGRKPNSYLPFGAERVVGGTSFITVLC